MFNISLVDVYSMMMLRKMTKSELIVDMNVSWETLDLEKNVHVGIRLMYVTRSLICIVGPMQHLLTLKDNEQRFSVDADRSDKLVHLIVESYRCFFLLMERAVVTSMLPLSSIVVNAFSLIDLLKLRYCFYPMELMTWMDRQYSKNVIMANEKF